MMTKLIIVSLLAVLIFPLIVSAQIGFLSIDCGALQPYLDPATGIQWVTDGNYIDSGSNTVVSGNVSHELTTLRYFPVLNSNCYVLPVGKNLKYSIWASFYYANYDGLNRWPSFNFTLSADGQWFQQFNRPGISVDQPMYLGLVFPSNQSSSVSLCLSSSDLSTNVPFISGLKLRTLPTGFYTEAAGDVFLHLAFRGSLGASSAGYLEYPDDKYDRRWFLENDPPPNAIAIMTNLNITTSDMLNQPPPKVMSSAFEGLNVSSFNYTVNLGTLSSKLAVYLYFMELRTRVATDVRMFYIYAQLNDEKQDTYLNIKYAGDWYVVWTTFTGGYDQVLSQATLTITMVPTSNSTLSPILNAIEVFKYDEPSPPTPSSPTPSPSQPTIPPSRPTTTPPPPAHSIRPWDNSGIGAQISYVLFFMEILFVIGFVA